MKVSIERRRENLSADKIASAPVNRTNQIHVVCCGTSPDNWRWIAEDVPEASWTLISGLSGFGFKRQLLLAKMSWKAVQAARRQKNPVILVTHGPSLSQRCALLCAAFRLNVRHLAYAFHHDTLPNAWRTSFMRLMVKQIDRLTMYSRLEVDQYHEHFGIPLNKLEMIHWATKKPDCLEGTTPIESGRYITSIGGSGRDYETLLKAMSSLPEIRLVLVARPGNLNSLEIPANVQVYTDLTLENTWNILYHSEFLVLPLATPETSCGHSVLVQAMWYSKAFVITQSSGVSDYVEHNKHELTCPAGDVEAMKECIQKLWHDSELQHKMGENGLQFARTYCSEESVISHFRNYMREVKD